MKAERAARASGNTCSMGKGFELVLSWFLRNQMVQDNWANNSKFKFSLIKNWNKSAKLEKWDEDRKDQIGSEFHTGSNRGQFQRAWRTPSGSARQWSQRSQDNTLRCSKLDFTGMELRMALHRKFLILFWTFKPQTTFQTAGSTTRLVGTAPPTSWDSNLYPDFTE